MTDQEHDDAIEEFTRLTARSAEQRETQASKIMRWALAALLIAVMISIVTTVATYFQGEDIETNAIRLEREQVASHRADWRLCERGNLVRAEDHETEKALRATERALRKAPGPPMRRQRGDIRERLPIMHCEPNLEGRPAYPMSYPEQDRFVRLYERNELDPTPGD